MHIYHVIQNKLTKVTGYKWTGCSKLVEEINDENLKTLTDIHLFKSV